MVTFVARASFPCDGPNPVPHLHPSWLLPLACFLFVIFICFSHLELACVIDCRMITYWLLLVSMEGPDSVVYIGSTSISLWTTDLISMYADCIFYFSCLVATTFYRIGILTLGLGYLILSLKASYVHQQMLSIYCLGFWMVQAMKVACKKFEGDHNFSNFCKMDAANVHNYMRTVTNFDILPINEMWAPPSRLFKCS